MNRTSLCRLCAGKSDNIPICNDGNYLEYKIKFTLNIEVKESDIRQTLCKLCMSKVNEFHDFKSMCRHTETQGLGFLKQTFVHADDVEDVKPFIAEIKQEEVDFDDDGPIESTEAQAKEDSVNDFVCDSSMDFNENVIKPIDIMADDNGIQGSGPENETSKSCDWFFSSMDVESESDITGATNADVNDKADTYVAATDEAATHMAATVVTDFDVAANAVATADASDDDLEFDICVSDAGKRKRESSPSVRVTRLATGVLPRKKVVYSDDSDPDDPDYADADAHDSSSDSDDIEIPQNPSIPQKAAEVDEGDTDKIQESTPPKRPQVDKGTCEKCEKKFLSSEELEDHKVEMHKNDTWYCYECLCGFPNLKTYKYHKRNFCKRGEVIRICVVCQETFKSVEELRVHAETCKSAKGTKDSKPIAKNTNSANLKPSSFHCSFCSIVTKNNTEFLEHLKSHRNSSPIIKCNLCDKTFKEKGALICHKEFHHKNLKQTADSKSSDVGKVDSSGEEIHIVVSRVKEFKCSKCTETFTSSSSLICHQALKHKTKRKS